LPQPLRGGNLRAMNDSGAPVPVGPGSVPPSMAKRLAEAGEISLRLLAGAVGKRTFETLRNQLPAATDQHAVLHQAVTAEPVEPTSLLGKALAAQRDWVGRGGRVAPVRLAFRGKRLLAQLCAQLVISAIYATLFLTALLALRYHNDAWDVYRLLAWGRDLLGAR